MVKKYLQIYLGIQIKYRAQNIQVHISKGNIRKIMQRKPKMIVEYVWQKVCQVLPLKTSGDSKNKFGKQEQKSFLKHNFFFTKSYNN